MTSIRIPTQIMLALLVASLVAFTALASSLRSAEALTNCSVADLSIDSEEQAFLGLINNYRASVGAGPLSMSSNLNRASSWMAVDLTTRADSQLSHTDASGRSWDTRLRDCDVPASSMAENIAAGYTTAQQVFDGWRASACP